MSKIDDLYREATGGAAGTSAEMAAFQQEFPNVYDLFCGRPFTADDPGRPPCTILLFPEGGKLKFCVKPKFGGLVAFGTISDPSKGLGGLDEAIAQGHLEWKQSKKRG